MSYRHITFDQSEVWKNFEKIIKKSFDPLTFEPSRDSKEAEKLLESKSLSPIEQEILKAISMAGVGMLPAVGDAVDFAFGIYYASKGDYFNSACSFISAIPGAGSVIGGGLKVAKLTGNLGKFVVKNEKEIIELANQIKNLNFSTNSVFKKVLYFILKSAPTFPVINDIRKSFGLLTTGEEMKKLTEESIEDMCIMLNAKKNAGADEILKCVEEHTK